MFARRIFVLVAALSAIASCAAQPTRQSAAPAQLPATAAQQPAAAAQPPAARPKAQARELSRAEFETLLASPEKLLIIDVRRPDELTKIGGFPVFLSVQIKELEKSVAWIPKDGRTIVTVSNHAARSGRAADFLTSKGYKVAGTVGAQTFEEQGGKLTKFEVPPPRTPVAAAPAPQVN